ncbi:U3 small nucleolar RNA-associated protein 5 [Nannizzia gypsea CBS 118893]|uniref:U3 small nucleolar RNA-associated protein 5 n=1 Tax=Arthroderma gypseum (strain ATCC MYA-4604 / CBS 118893) TaxID=535722 RepID=E4V1I3_ARTGP|nr:U3 small nucleolar RNA-associated protein 5 [Nannizzia gypsea CBS 118893]EFR03898.1 U3 small nucleolar RNA-associated protein 5 [Nannizzia gypsea CBS 118893]
MGKKSSSRAVSRISSTAALSTASATVTVKKSSIIRSAFSPSEFQLALFASVIQGLDAHHVRIHSTSSGRLQCEHAVNPKESVTSLDWGYYGEASRGDQPMKKRRKRHSGVNGMVAGAGDDAGAIVIAFGTSTSEIRMYCPAEDKVTGVLAGGHEKGVRDFKFTPKKPAQEGWSIGGDGKLVQWNLRKGDIVRVISLPSTSISALARPVPASPPVLCASQTPYLIDPDNETSDSEPSFSSMKDIVHSLISSNTDYTDLSGPFLASDSDRYVNVFNPQNKQLLGSLVANKEIDLVTIYPGSHKGSNETENSGQKQQLAVVTRDGAIEIFSNPFHQFGDSSASGTSGASLKSLRKSMTRRPDAIIKLVKPDKTRTPVPVVSVCFDGADLVVVWVEGGIDLVFDRIPWLDETTQELIYNGETELVRGKSSSNIGNAMMNGVKDLGKSHVDESQAIVEQGGFAEGTDDEAEEDETSDKDNDSDEELDDADPTSNALTTTNEDVEMADHTDADDAAEPSFGELLASAPQTISVSADFMDKTSLLQSKALPAESHQLPAGLSLATVLSQSLKTNDNTLLESCFHTKDMAIVKTTVQRLDSSLAATLLQKLAERLSTRPGRYGHLLMWVQWTCIAHGGSIASNRDVLKKISSLFKVMEQRSASLPSLLLLKGKLDMLDAQLTLRQSLQGRDGRVIDPDEERVIYVEGQEDIVEDEDEDEDEAMQLITEGEHASSHKKARDILDDNMFADKEGDEDMPMTNGVEYDEGEDQDDEEDDEEELIDDEAEVSDDGEGEDDDEEEDSDEEPNYEEEASLLEFLANSDEEESDVSDTPATKSKRK